MPGVSKDRLQYAGGQGRAARYVAALLRASSPQATVSRQKVGRNEPCPCGSGNRSYRTVPPIGPIRQIHVILHLCWTHIKKPGEPGFSSIQWVCLVKRADICCLFPFRATRDVEGNLLAFCECFEALSLNSGEMDEHVFAAAIRGNETKAFRAVEPFNGTNCHV
jgi:hypothetical protein